MLWAFFSPSHRLGDDGGQAICGALLKNKALTHVHLGSNDLGEPTAAILSQVLKNISGIIILGALHCTRDEFEIAALLLRLGLPSILTRHETGAFRKRSSNRRNLKMPALRLSVDGKHFENEAF